MGNCANKPLTTEGEVPEVADEQKTPKVDEISSREIGVDQNKVISATVADDHHVYKPISLAQMLENEGKKPEAEATAKPADGVKPSQPAKFEDVVAMAVETKKEEAPKPTAEPPKSVAEPPKPAAEPPKPAAEPPKPATEPPKPAAEPPKPAAEPPKPAVELKKDEVKPVVVAPATAPAVVDEKKPVTK